VWRARGWRTCRFAPRLRDLLARIEIEGEDFALASGGSSLVPAGNAAAAAAAGAEKKAAATDVYTEASPELLAARAALFAFSTERAALRLAGVKRRRESEQLAAEADADCAAVYEGLRRLGIVGSQLGDERPLACVRCAPNAGGLVATGSLAPAVKVWDVASMELQGLLGGSPGVGHAERSTGLDWHPSAFASPAPPLLATASADSTAKIWQVTASRGGGDGGGKSTAAGTCAVTLTGHKHRLGMVAFHPSGEYVGTASFDRTWRLWHAETGREVLLQDGHVKEVYFLAFQKDGALVASGDFAGVGNVWDLRAGRKVMALTGHVKRVVAGDFAPNGFQVVTGGDDHTARVWDLRMRKCSYTLPGHSSLISETRFDPSGEALLTTSFDGSAKVWGCRDWRKLADLRGHEGKVMAGDWAPGGAADSSGRGALGVVTVGFDRTLKLWEQH